MVCLIMTTVITHIRLLRFGENIVTLRWKNNLINAPLDYEPSFQKAPILLAVILNKCPGLTQANTVFASFKICSASLLWMLKVKSVLKLNQ